MTKPPIDLRAVLAGKAELMVHAADLTVTARALAKLLAEKCDYLFVHGGRPVIVELGEDDAPPTMRPAGVNEIIIAAHKHCQPVKPKSPSERPAVTLPDKVAELYLAMRDEWRLRPLTSFTNGPLLRDDGTIYCELGYDASTGIFIYNLPKITVPDKPSRDDAVSALKTVRRAFRTFPFADRITVDETFSVDGKTITVKVVDLEQPPGKSESAHLVGLLTAVCRPSLLIAPAIALRSPALSGSGVGKKLLLQSVALIAFGQGLPSVALGRSNEFEKGMVAAVIRPDPGVVIDNINGRKLQSETLCTVLTDRPAMVRVLGVSELKEANPRQLICITGTAFTVAEDLIRRQFVVELDAKVENPEQRKFAGNFLADITAQRAELLQAVLTIWRFGRQNAATLKRGQPLGGFEQWSAWARDPLLGLGCRDPVTEIAELKTSDPVRLEKLEIFQTWWEYHGNDAVKAKDLNDAVQAVLVPDPNKRSRQNIASCVARLDGTRLAGFHLTSDKDDKNRGRWTPISYRLEFSEAESEQATDATLGDEEQNRAAAAKPAPSPKPPSDILSDVLLADPDGWQFNREPTDADILDESVAPQDGRLYTIGPEPDHACVQCGENDGQVYLIRNNFSPNPAAQPLHEGKCARRYFEAAKAAPPPRAPAVQAPITAEEMDELKRRGFSLDDLFNMNPKRARAIIADPSRNKLSERYGKGADAPPDTICRVCKEAGARYFSDPDPLAGQREDYVGGSFPLHLKCCEEFFSRGGLVLEGDEAASETPKPEPGPLPSDPVERWRMCFARLDPRRDPCAGFRTNEWPRVYDVIQKFLAGPFAKHAADAGWTDLELFGVHPEVGVARPNACGALMTNAYGSPVTQVTPLLIRFANGLAVYKARLSVANSVAVWDYREPAANEYATCRIKSPPWSEERNA